MKAKFLKSTNLLMSNKYAGSKGEFNINTQECIAYFTISLSSMFHTSYVLKQVVLEDDTFEIHTFNSIYTFKSYDGVYKPIKLKKASKELLSFAEANKKSKFQEWVCILDGGFLNGLRSKVTLPFPMTKTEAQKYVLENGLLDDIENMKISILMQPVIDNERI